MFSLFRFFYTPRGLLVSANFFCWVGVEREAEEDMVVVAVAAAAAAVIVTVR